MLQALCLWTQRWKQCEQKDFRCSIKKVSMEMHGTCQHIRPFVIGIGLFVFCLSIYVSMASAEPSCDYYASPNGSGNGLSLSSPFRIADFWSRATSGTTLCLLDGIYTGSASMIDPPDNLNGTSNSPISIIALNDGKVSINGQGSRQPIILYYNNYFVIEGVNAYNSIGTVVQVSRSSNVVVRRVVAWDAADQNTKIFGISYSQDVLLEDVAGFGRARKTFEPYYTNGLTIRRAWGRWEGNHIVGPKMTYSLTYNSYNILIENSLGTWSGEGMGGENVDQPYGVFGVDRLDGDPYTNSKILGSIAYVRRSDDFRANQMYFVSEEEGVEYRDNVAYFEPGTYADRRTFLFVSKSGVSDRSAHNITSVGGGGSYFASDVAKSNLDEGTKLDAVSSIFTGDTGAKVCTRYVDGVLTGEPLWPWPMNQRIIDALTAAGKKPVDVTATIEQLFGPIPGNCKQNNVSLAPPSNLRLLGAN